MGRVRFWLAVVLQLLLVGCGSGSDDGPVKGSGRGGESSPTTTSYFLNVSVANPSALSAPAKKAGALSSTATTAASANERFSAKAVSDLTRSNFEAVVLVEDFNAVEGFREVPVGIASFESFGNGIYRVDIDGLPQVNGIIYVTVGGSRLVFLMLRAGTQAEPVDVNQLTTATNLALLDVLKNRPEFPSVSVADAVTAQETTTGCLADLDTSGVEDLAQFYADQIVVLCHIPDLGPVDACPGESGLCSVSGMVTGLQRGQLLLLLNESNEISVSGDGEFAFETELRNGSRFVVRVGTQPSGQFCTVENGSGFVEGAAINNVQVVCQTTEETYSIGGTVSGLAGTLQLALGEIETLPVAGSGTFAFETELFLQDPYSVTIAQQPNGQSCVIQNGSGVVSGAVTDIQISCTTVQPLYQIGGTFNGLVGTIQLSLNEGAAETWTGSGTFIFSTSLPQGATYHVALVSYPTTEICELSGGSGTVGAQAVNSIVINCSTAQTRRVTGTASGVGQGVQLSLNGGEPLTVQNGSFAFDTLFYPSDQYEVVVTATLGGERCLVTNGAGNFANGDANVTVDCALFPGSISAGASHTCVTRDGGTRCWGSNYYRQLGVGETLDSSFPVIAAAGSAATEISAGDQHNCALLNSGGVRCWGNDNLGQSAINPEDAQATVPLLGSAQGVAAGLMHSCAILLNGDVQCWGYVDSDGENDNLFLPAFVGGINASALAAGSNHTCALTTDGAVRCWGNNDNGQLGDGTTTSTETPVTVLNVGRALALAAHQDRTCAVTTTGTVFCWGGSFGQTPQAVPGITRAIDVGVGTRHACVTTVDGIAQCWGGNEYGQLGDGGTEDSATPVAVTDIANAVAVAAGDYHNCALLADSAVVCWGSNFNSQLSAASQAYGGFNSELEQISGASQVSSGSDHNCALTATGVYCWGSNEFGQLGNNSNTDSSAPVLALAATTPPVSKVSVGDRHSCALQAGQVSCWGDNTAGQVGAGDGVLGSLLPNVISGVVTAIDMSAGADFNCAVLQTGSVVCWGNNASGQLGAVTPLLSNLPLPIPQLIGAATVSTGRAHACALLTTGQVQCWGANNNGQLGDGSTEFANSATPVTVAGITDAVAIDAGGDNTCARLESGELRCWGDNSEGQIGNGGNGNRYSTPQPVSLAFAPDLLSVNDAQICAAPATGLSSCWGLMSTYWMTDSTYYVVYSSPTEFNTSAVSFSASTGSQFTCGVTANGNVFCNGRNDKGQVGLDPLTVYSALPLEVDFAFAQ